VATRPFDRSCRCTYQCTYPVRRRSEHVFTSTRVRSLICASVTEVEEFCLRMNDLERPRQISWNHCLGGQTDWLRNCAERFVLQMQQKSLEYGALDRLLYSVADAAIVLSCSRNTVYSLIRSGKIVAVYPTSKARVTATSLVRFIERMESETRSERQSQRSMTR
jgi:excisionase family DNA binding protein